jgi:hypothetical protein
VRRGISESMVRQRMSRIDGECPRGGYKRACIDAIAFRPGNISAIPDWAAVFFGHEVKQDGTPLAVIGIHA